MNIYINMFINLSILFKHFISPYYKFKQLRVGNNKKG